MSCVRACPPYTVHKLLLYQQSGGPDGKNNHASRKDKKKNNGQVFHQVVRERQKMRPVSAFTARSQRDGGNLCICDVKLPKNNDKLLCVCVCILRFCCSATTGPMCFSVPSLIKLPFFSANKGRVYKQRKRNRLKQTTHGPGPAQGFLLGVPPTSTHGSGVLSDCPTFYQLYRAKGNGWRVSTGYLRQRKEVTHMMNQATLWLMM